MDKDERKDGEEQKYLRAITDKHEKKDIVSLIRSKKVTAGVCLALVVISIIEGLIFSSMAEKGKSAPMALFYVALVLAFVCFLVYLSVRSAISAKMSLILTRPLREDEGEEIREYRARLHDEIKADRAALRKNVIPACVGGVIFVVLAAAETIMHPESVTLGTLYIVGLVFFVAGVAATIVLNAVYDHKKEKKSASDGNKDNDAR